MGRWDQRSCPPGFPGRNVHQPASTEPSRTLSFEFARVWGRLGCWSTLLSLEQTSAEAQVVGSCGLGSQLLASWHLGGLFSFRGSLVTSQPQGRTDLAHSLSCWVQRQSLALGEEEGEESCYYSCLTISA